MPSTAEPKSKIADRDTPLIKNCWYVLDWSKDVKSQLKNRMVVNQDLVYFRTQDGEICALQNRCAHRCFPLHRSKLKENDTIQCGYHGLTYNTDGECVLIPSSLALNPSFISLHKYPVVEKFPMVWVWPGDAERADPSLIPDYDWVNKDNWGYGTGFYHVKGNYLAIHENLLDLTNFEYLHGAVLGAQQQTEAKVKVTVEDNKVITYRFNEGDPVPDLHKEATGLNNIPVTRHSTASFVTPGFHDGDSLFEDKEGNNNGRIEYKPHILHFITPETQYTSLYWWVFGRDFSAPDKKIDDWYSDVTRKVFEEDKEAIEWIEYQWANDDRPGFTEKHVPSDEGAVKMRQVVHELAMQETTI